MDSQTEEALVASKVDYLAEEYSQLLVSQLDAQRAYFSGLLGKQAEEAESRAQESTEHCKSLETALHKSNAEAKAAERKCRSAEKRLVSFCYSSAARHVSLVLGTCPGKQACAARALDQCRAATLKPRHVSAIAELQAGEFS